ncbi:hypothetical protein LVISKB_0968 [Levilactobacillus brevis KB290]|uniref:Uncharacterized protein n=1 Tax=Levilactobacillus brevis KB290 TaxID=1001583 RepID=M5ACQ7_LEVBR|nr:hypothetical protein LVISKB_0968 [Levilactobacillus brevis KB290]
MLKIKKIEVAFFASTKTTLGAFPTSTHPLGGLFSTLHFDDRLFYLSSNGAIWHQ